MPLSWIPKRREIEQDIAEELAKIEVLKFGRRQVTPEVETPQWQPTQRTTMVQTMPQVTPTVRQFQPTVAQPVTQWQPRMVTPRVIEPVTPVKIPAIKEEELGIKSVTVPFWQRALQAFSAPFNWIDENIIKPGESLLGTTAGFVPEVERQAGEDFWEWKKRSWAGWKSPGININVPWSDEPWRIDVRGVIELAPWLLIPGAGQVGGGVRAGVGIAGMLGKAGRVGRVLGKVVEYSPWGLVEKTAGVAIKGGFRVVGNISEKVSTQVGEKVFGKYQPVPPSPAVTKLAGYFKEVVIPARRQFKKLVPEQVTAKQEAKVQQVFASYRKGEIPVSELQARLNMARGGVGIKEGFALTPEALATRQAKAISDVEARVASGEISEASGKGLITKINKSPAFTSVPFTDTEVKEFSDLIINGVESGLVKADSADAFLKLVLEGKLPQPHNIRDWSKVFGDDFAKSVGRLKTMPPDKVSQTLDALNIGRSLQTSLDLSATLRQGLILSLLHPTQVPVWFGRQVKALFSEKWALEIDDVMRANPQFKEIVANTGAYFAPIREATLTTAEELFASKTARRIPGIRRSERAFITYLNQARYSALKDGYNTMLAQGATSEQLKLLGRFVDLASGRGEMPKSLERFSPVLNAMLFSPKLQAATLQLPRQIGRMLISKNPYMRKEAAKALVTFVGGGVGLLSLIDAAGNKVETDPRSGDFGKIKIGETRLDIWRGYVQYARFAAQLLTGERKSAYGNMNKAERSEIVSRFLQSKSSPAFGLMVDLLRGENYQGEPIFRDTTGFSKVARERVLPLAVQDIIDAMEQGGINGLWVAAPATLGVGALTYVNDFVRVKEKIAREMGYESWDDIDPKTQREIQNRNTELQVATIAFDRQVMGTAWGDWRLAGNAIEDVFKQNVENAVNQYRQSTEPNRGITFRKDIGDAFIARRGGYAVREKEGRFEDIVKRLNTQDPLEALVGLGTEQTAIKIYNDALYGDDMYDEFGDYRFDEADIRKQQLRQQLGSELFAYVEEYQGLKYETFPPEFQELIKAKIVLRPYWKIQDEAIRLFGEPQTAWQQTRLDAFITKMRKRLRKFDPEIEKYYQLFYSTTQ